MIRLLYLILSIGILSSCNDSVSTDNTYELNGRVTSDFDGSSISGAKILLDGVVVDSTDENGRFEVPEVDRGDYTFKVNAVENHRSIEINRLSFYSAGITLNVRLPFKFNLINSINSSEFVDDGNNLIDSYSVESAPTILNDESRLSVQFDEYIFSTDTVEFAYFHAMRPGELVGESLFDHGINLNFLNTDLDATVFIQNFNDENIRTIRYFPVALGADSTKELEVSITSNPDFSVEELNIMYLTSY